MNPSTGRITDVVRNGHRIVVVDLSHIRPDEAIIVIHEAEKVISTYAAKSALVLTDVTNASYNKESAEAIKGYSARNTPYVRASAVVGANGLRGVLLTAVRVLTGRDIRTFPDRAAAIEWLSTRA